MFKACIDIDQIIGESGHACDKCKYLIVDSAGEIFHHLPNLEESVETDVKAALVYIAGYITRECCNIEGTYDYYSEFGDYIKEINRGGLMIPVDNASQWTIFSYILFHKVADFVCRTSLCNILMSISEFYDFNMGKYHGKTLSNILLKNHVTRHTPRSSKEPKQKAKVSFHILILKLCTFLFW